MPSVIYRALSKTTFNFNSLNGNNQTFGYTVARHLDVADFYEFSVIWRIHSVSITQTPSVKLEVWAEVPTEDDPGMNCETGFITTTTVALSSLAVPYVIVQGKTANNYWGYSLRLKVFGIQGATAGNLVVTLSADLVGKS
jgi:hypothetical protein